MSSLPPGPRLPTRKSTGGPSRPPHLLPVPERRPEGLHPARPLPTRAPRRHHKARCATARGR
eukprot:10920742-Alexandrium_andersonii.AAC.1